MRQVINEHRSLAWIQFQFTTLKLLIFVRLCVSVTSRRARETIHAKISKIQKFDLEI